MAVAVVLSGGGARGAYQAGFLYELVHNVEELKIEILYGTSAGALNAAYIAANAADMKAALTKLVEIWESLEFDLIFDTSLSSFAKLVIQWTNQLLIPPYKIKSHPSALLNTTPFDKLLRKVFTCVDSKIYGIERNVQEGHIKALAISTLNYTTGVHFTWVQSNDEILWRRTGRIGVSTKIGLSHVKASAAIPFFFPAVEIKGCWHGDGSIRLIAPFSAPIHLGADKIIAISNRTHKEVATVDHCIPSSAPSPGIIAESLINSIFLDTLESDALTLERINMLISEENETKYRKIKFAIIRPSVDLGQIAKEYVEEFPGILRFLLKKVGRGEIPKDLASLLLFTSVYTARIIEIGRADARRVIREIRKLLL